MRTYTYIALCGIMAILMQQRGKMRTTKPHSNKKNDRPNVFRNNIVKNENYSIK